MEDLNSNINLSIDFNNFIGPPADNDTLYYGITVLSVTTRYIIEESLKQMKDFLMSPNVQICDIHTDDRLVGSLGSGERREGLYYTNTRIYFYEPLKFEELDKLFKVYIPGTDKHREHSGPPFGGVFQHCYLKTEPVDSNVTFEFLHRAFDLGEFKINSKAKSAAKVD